MPIIRNNKTYSTAVKLEQDPNAAKFYSLVDGSISGSLDLSSSGITSLKNGAFTNCTGLTSVTLPSAVTAIPDNCFYGCTGITSIPSGGSLTSFGQDSFRSAGLTSINLPEGTTHVGIGAFAGNGYAASFHIPASLLPENDMYDQYTGAGKSTQDGLTSITFGTGATYMPSLYNCRVTGTITLPSTITTISGTFIHDCDGVFTLDCSQSSVTATGINTFANSSGLVCLKLPATLATTDGGEFANNPNLTEIWCYATVPPTINHSDAFESINSNLVIYVPAGSVTAYQSAYGWSKVSSRIQAIPTV